MRLRTLVTGVVAASAAVMLSAAPTLAGQGSQRGATAKAGPQSGMAAHLAAQDQTMMADREKMMQEMTRADQRLDAPVATMNAASVTQKGDAAVVSEMVTERRAMRDRMMTMQDGMMAT